MIERHSPPSNHQSFQQAGPSQGVWQVVVPEAVEAVVRSLPDPSAWLQRVIIEAAIQELLTSSTLNLVLQPDAATAYSPQPELDRQEKFEPEELPVGCLVRNPLRWLGRVKTYNSTSGRYLVAFQNGIDRDFPRHLLTFVALTPED